MNLNDKQLDVFCPPRFRNLVRKGRKELSSSYDQFQGLIDAGHSPGGWIRVDLSVTTAEVALQLLRPCGDVNPRVRLEGPLMPPAFIVSLCDSGFLKELDFTRASDVRLSDLPVCLKGVSRVAVDASSRCTSAKAVVDLIHRADPDLPCVVFEIYAADVCAGSLLRTLLRQRGVPENVALLFNRPLSLKHREAVELTRELGCLITSAGGSPPLDPPTVEEVGNAWINPLTSEQDLRGAVGCVLKTRDIRMAHQMKSGGGGVH